MKMHDNEKQKGYIRAAYLVSTYMKVTDNCNARKYYVEENEVRDLDHELCSDCDHDSTIPWHESID